MLPLLEYGATNMTRETCPRSIWTNATSKCGQISTLPLQVLEKQITDVKNVMVTSDLLIYYLVPLSDAKGIMPFIFDGCFIGMCSQSAEHGNEIGILRGAQVSYVLRKVETGHYRIVRATLVYRET